MLKDNGSCYDKAKKKFLIFSKMSVDGIYVRKFFYIALGAKSL